MRGIMENNADTGLIVRTDQQLDPTNSASRSWPPCATANAAPAPPTARSSSGAAPRSSQPELSSADLQFLENRKFSRAEICAAFGVPEEIITTTDNAKYDVMPGARLNFIENRVAPLCARLEADEDATVKAIDPAAVGWFDLDSLPILQQARRDRLAAARTGFDMGIPFNELNRVFDLGFKPLPWGDKGYMPTRLQPADRSAGVPPAECGISPQPSRPNFPALDLRAPIRAERKPRI